MIKKKVLALDDRDDSKASTHVIIEQDNTVRSNGIIKDKDELK